MARYGPTIRDRLWSTYGFRSPKQPITRHICMGDETMIEITPKLTDVACEMSFVKVRKGHSLYGSLTKNAPLLYDSNVEVSECLLEGVYKEWRAGQYEIFLNDETKAAVNI